LPESVRFLAVRRAAPERINRIMKRLAPAGVWEGVWWSAPETETERKRSSLIEVFRDGRALSTCLIAAALMATLLSAYFVLAFTPLLLSLSGISLEQSALAGMILLAGGPFGTLLWGWLVGKYWPPLVFAISAAIPAVCFSLVGFSLNTYYLLMILLLFGGIGMASVNAYNGFVASIYPTHIRGTASGLTITLGRIGSVSGPLLGGALVAQGWSIAELYYVPAAWSAVAFVCALLLGATSISRRFIGGARMMARS
jgi:AAHS family 4-hydroxybenzoate transporter-like MFS transporter